ARPRGAATGDRGEISWDLLTEYLRRLERWQLPADDPGSSVAAVDTLLADFSRMAAERARVVAELDRQERAELVLSRRPKDVIKRTLRTLKPWVLFWRRPKPFQGTLTGVEGALVDLVARVHDRPPAELFGRRARALRDAMPQPYGAPDNQEEIFERVLRRVINTVAFPAPPAPTHNGQPSTSYDEVPYLRPLGSNGTKGHLLEREAL